jgi:hypothetical protein
MVGARTTLVCDDSVAFLARWVREHPGEHADLVYLDSYDVEFDAPLPAAEHCVREIEAIAPALGPGSLLLVDDTPGSRDDVPPELRDMAEKVHRDLGLWPGKGMHLDAWLADHRPGAEKVHHRYQVLYRF